MKEMTMWKMLRKQYTKYSLDDIGKQLGVTRQTVSKYENGEVRMPTEVQIIYLGFRNNEYDKLIISYLKEIVDGRY